MITDINKLKYLNYIFKKCEIIVTMKFISTYFSLLYFIFKFLRTDGVNYMYYY